MKFDYALLKKKISDFGSAERLCSESGIDGARLRDVLDGRSFFESGEIMKIVQCMDIAAADIDKCFFAKAEI